MGVQAGEGSGALKPPAPGDTGSPGAMNYSRMGSRCINGGTRPWGWETPLAGSKEGEEQVCKVCTALPGGSVWMYPALGTEEHGRRALETGWKQPQVDSSRGGGRNPTTTAAATQMEGPRHWHRTAGGEGLGGSMIPAALPPCPEGQTAPLNPVPGQQRGEHNLRKSAVAKVLCVY